MLRPAPFFLLIGVFAFSSTADAQIWNRAKRAAQRGVERAVERQVENRSRRATESAIDAMFAAGEGAVRCVFTDEACIEGAQANGDAVVLTDRDGAPVDPNGDPVTEANVEDAVLRTGGAARTLAGADANYDFEPGERALFAEDFSDDRVGDFPRSLYYLSGTGEVVDFGGQRFLRFTSGGAFQIQLPQTLPSTFTIEFDAQVEGGEFSVYTAPRTYDDDRRPFYDGYEGDYLNLGNWQGSGLWNQSAGLRSVGPVENGKLLHVEVTVDDAYVKMYVDGQRVANVPRADLGRHDEVTFQVGARHDRLAYIGNIRIAAGGNDLYSALESEGRVVTEGVLFDTASATLQPQSFAVVQEIAEMLQAHPALRVRIEGHTDNEGEADANQKLSEARARAVHAMLVGLGVDAGRLEAVGMGQAQPVASNDTTEGRRQNRRVELVRL